jgi:hypothetical protein
MAVGHRARSKGTDRYRARLRTNLTTKCFFVLNRAQQESRRKQAPERYRQPSQTRVPPPDVQGRKESDRERDLAGNPVRGSSRQVPGEARSTGRRGRRTGRAGTPLVRGQQQARSRQDPPSAPREVVDEGGRREGGEEGRVVAADGGTTPAHRALACRCGHALSLPPAHC